MNLPCSRNRVGKRIVTLGLLAACLALAGFAASEKSAKEQLAPLQPLIGQWKGVGQPQRGSTKGAWQEKADWAWKFGPETALSAAFDQGKYFTAARLVTTDKAGQFNLHATPVAASDIERRVEIVFAGKQEESQLVLTAEKVPEGTPARVTIRLVAGGDRLLILYERRVAADQYARLAEVGYTRIGSDFGQGGGGRECIITGGLGTMAVMHEGQTYYVCCTGCREYFNDNPAKSIAEYKERKAEEKAAREKKPK